MVEAGWELYDHLEGLTEAPPGDPGAKGISHCLSNMDAVAEQRQRFAVMGKTSNPLPDRWSMGIA